MNPSQMTRAYALTSFGLVLVSVFAFFVGLWFLSNLALQHFPLWLCSDCYVAGELEVTRFNPVRGRRGQGHTIEGVLHPSGERVLTSTQ